MFSYLCGGINFTEIANLTKDNIIEGKRLHYIRQKTGKLIKTGLSEEAMKIRDYPSELHPSNFGVTIVISTLLL